jgi:uncharacterized membrane protein YedE/YeeE
MAVIQALMETNFTPLTGTLGGILIGIAAITLMATCGRIMGASSIFSGIFDLKNGIERNWRMTFVLGILIGAAWTALFFPATQNVQFISSTPVTIMGGLIVGFGVVLGSGCTSGHGICGLSRFSMRSLVATCIFMIVAILTVTFMRRGFGA